MRKSKLFVEYRIERALASSGKSYADRGDKVYSGTGFVLGDLELMHARALKKREIRALVVFRNFVCESKEVATVLSSQCGQGNRHRRSLGIGMARLIEWVDYSSDPEQVALMSGVAEALKRAKGAGCRLFMHTNQSGVGRGYFAMSDAHAVNRRMFELMGIAEGFFRYTVFQDAA